MLKVENLSIQSGEANLLENVNFKIATGSIVGLMGNSGSGKSILARFLLGEIPASFTFSVSHYQFNEVNLSSLPQKSFQKLKGKQMGYVPQHFDVSLNPIRTCGSQLVEMLQYHNNLSYKQAKNQAITWLKRVHLTEKESAKYPFELSGGQAQRVLIAMALCSKPTLFIADEITTALDPLTEKEIIALLLDLQSELNFGILFISHDLDLVSSISDSIYIIDKKRLINNLTQPKEFGELKNAYNNNHPKNHKKAPLPKTNQTLIDVNSIWFSYDQLQDFIKDLSMHIQKGEYVGLIGESGSGKSTLAKLIVGFNLLNKGSIEINHIKYTQLDEPLTFIRKYVQYIPQSIQESFNRQVPLSKSLKWIANAQKITSPTDTIHALCSELDIDPKILQRIPSKVSGGQLQRISILAALLCNPKLLICDEIFSSLDRTTQFKTMKWLTKIGEQRNLSFLVISHDTEVVKSFCHKMYIVKEGKILGSGSWEQLKNSDSQYVRNFLNALW